MATTTLRGRRVAPARWPAALFAAALTAVLLAACGSSSTTTTPSTAPSSSATVKATSSSLGSILVDTHGRTLYLLTSEAGSKPTCTSSPCTTIWPPLLMTSGSPTGSGVKGSLGTVTLPDGSKQVTYNGYPLHTFAPDTGAGQVHGQGVKSFGGTWYVLSASATGAGSTPVSSASSGGTSSSGSSSSSGGGSGY